MQSHRHTVGIVLGLCLLPGLLFSQAPGAAPPPAAKADASRYVFVPYDGSAGPRLEAEQSVLIPYAEFLRLKSAENGKPDSPEFRPFASLSQSVYRGQVRDGVVRLECEMTLEVLARAEDTLEIPVSLSGISAESAVVEGEAAYLVPMPDGKGFTVVVRGGGKRVLRCRLAAPLLTQGAQKRIDFRIPRAAAASLHLRIPADMTLEPAPQTLPAVAIPEKDGGTLIEASLGGSDRVHLVFVPRIEAVEEVTRTRIAAHQETTFSVRSQSVEARVKFDIKLLAGQTDHLVIELPAAVRLLGIKGSFIREWSEPDASRQVQVKLVRAVSDGFDVVMDVQLDSVSAPERLTLPEFRVPGAVRESGVVVISPEPGLFVWPEEVSGLESVPLASGQSQQSRSYRFAQPGWKLVLTRRAVPARIQSAGTLLYEVTEEQIQLRSRHRLTLSGRGIFDVHFEVPEGFELREAGPSQVVSGYRQQTRRVEVNLRSEQTQSVEIELRLQKPRVAGEGKILLEPIVVGGAEEDAGSVILAAPVALRATELFAVGLEAADVRLMHQAIQPLLTADLVPVLGYRYFRPDFKGTCLMERQRTRLLCETATLASIQPTLLRVDVTLNYTVEFSATDEFRLLIPAASGEDVRFSGADIKEKIRSTPRSAGASAETDGLTTWTIRLQRRVLGSYQLGVAYDLPLAGVESGRATMIRVPLARALNVARETGHLGISRGENLELRVLKSEGLETRDVKELPPALSHAFLGFRYFEPTKCLLELEALRHELESVLGALIRRMHIDTVLNNQREAVHEVFFDVQNNREQYLEMKLPATMSIWSAFVRGNPVRPTVRQSDGAYLIELTKSESKDDAFRVRLILRETLAGGALGTFGKLAFSPPDPRNIPVLRMTWKLYLPREYRYIEFGGTMRATFRGDGGWALPIAEEVLTNMPARMAGGIARPALEPQEAFSPVHYESTETEQEKQARLRGAALDVPIVREGVQFEFSKLSGVGTIEINYWKRKPLLLLQGAWGALVLLVLLGVMGMGKRLGVGLAAVVIALIAASLTTGLAGRLFATALLASAAALGIESIIYLARRPRTHPPRQPAAPPSPPPPPFSPPAPSHPSYPCASPPLSPPGSPTDEFPHAPIPSPPAGNQPYSTWPGDNSAPPASPQPPRTGN